AGAGPVTVGARGGPGPAGPGRAGLVGTGLVGTGLVGTGLARAGPARAGRVGTDDPRTTTVRPRTPPLIGRTDELAVHDRAFADVSAGRGRLVLLAGEAGIGKTRLASELVAAASGQGAWTAWGRGTEVEGAPPSWFWSQIIRAFLAVGDPEELRRALGTGAADIAQIVPEVAQIAADVARPWPAEPAAARFRLYEAVAAFLSRLAARRPLVLVLDDLQWADVPSLELTELLVQRLPDLPVMLVVTYRDREVAAAPAVASTLGALARSAVLDRLVLEGLSEREVGAFVAQATGVELGSDVVAIVHARTDGNPFFVAEMARTLATEGGLDDPATSLGEVPPGIREVLRRRLAALPDGTRTLLATASAAGREFALAVVAAADDVTPAAAADLLDAAVTAGLVDEDRRTAGQYQFSHVLVRDAIYDEIGTHQRTGLHGRVGRALAARDDGSLALVSDLARHFYLAAPVVGPEPGMAAAMRAAEAAQAALAFEQAEVHLRQAVDLLATMPRDRERDRQELELQLRLGFLISQTRGRAWPEGARAFARAQELCASTGVTADQLRTLWGQFFIAYVTCNLADAAGVGARLLDLGRRAEDARCQLAGLIAEGTSEFFLGRLAEARAHLAQAASIADSMEEAAANLYQQDARVASRNLLVLAVWLVGDYEEAEAIAAEQARLATIVDHRPTQLAVPLSHGWLRLLQRDPEQVAEVVTRTLSLAAEIGHRPIALAAAMHQGWAMAQLGSTQAGAAQLRRTLEDLDAVRMVAARPCFLGLLAEAELLDGRPEAALATVDAALAEVARRGDRFYLPELFRLKGEMLRASGSEREATARACFQQALQAAEAQGAVPFRDRAAKSLAEGRRTA
ncbi:MAG: hypothetical protein QOI99_1056, partial [Actinomycetota bacterium]|nr:hypothetical protein [Actinomycetota bacterium]